MDNDTRQQIMFNIQNELTENVDEKQLLNMVQEQADCYVLRAYGQTLKFNKEDGSLIQDEWKNNTGRY